MAHAQSVLARLPDALFIVISATDAVGVLLWVGFFQPEKPLVPRLFEVGSKPSENAPRPGASSGAELVSTQIPRKFFQPHLLRIYCILDFSVYTGNLNIV